MRPAYLSLLGGGMVTAVFLILWQSGTSAEPAKTTRQPWIGSTIRGTPEPPPPYRLVRSFPNLKFNHPLLLTRLPGQNRFVLAEQDGKLFTFANQPDAKAELIFDIRADLKNLKTIKETSDVEAIYGFVFHPEFLTNRYCYLCYTLKGKKGEQNHAEGTHVARFRIPDLKTFKLDPESESTLLTFMQGGHNGGDLHFGPDGYLYIGTGDAAAPNPPDSFATGQDVSDLLSSVLRIDVNRSDTGKNYAVPVDNPFVGQSHNGKPIRPEIWAYGFRNAWRMSFDRVTGELFVGDVGWEAWEMIHKVEKGGNCGWSIVEGRQQVNTQLKLGPTPVTPPIIELSHALAGSISGGYVYRGTKHKDLVGKYIFGDWMTRRMWAATTRGQELLQLDEITPATVRIVAYGEDDAGELYALDYDAGTIHTFEANKAEPTSTVFPKTLSESGLFRDTASGTMASGVYPFEISSHQWQDRATAQYWMAFPDMSKATDYEKRRAPAGSVDWRPFHLHPPKNGVLVKTISLETEPGKTSTRQRLETQLLHYDGEEFRAYTYAWRADQSDADLVPAEGAERTLRVVDPLFGPRELTWTFSSRVQCMQCHNSWAEYSLGFNREQLNRMVPTTAGPKNQLTDLAEFGLLDRLDAKDQPQKPYTTTELAKGKSFANPHDETAPLDARARSYLHANCGHCHRMGGGGAVDFELHADADLKAKVIDIKPVRGTFDLPDARLIAAGDPLRSVVLYRMAKFGSGRMPHYGSECVDERGVNLIRQWIASMKPDAKPDTGELSSDSIPQKLASLPQAMWLAREFQTPKATATLRNQVLANVVKLPAGPVRDLFEGYLPNEGKPRTLGLNPRPRAILSLAGDSTRGKALFANQNLQCVKCHKVGALGVEVGPNLDTIGSTRTREHLLESLLDPSRRIESAYQTVSLNLADGKQISGVVVKSEPTALTLKDVQGTIHKIATDDIETRTLLRPSLMPEGLLRDLTAAQAADLLAYLESLKRP